MKGGAGVLIAVLVAGILVGVIGGFAAGRAFGYDAGANDERARCSEEVERVRSAYIEIVRARRSSEAESDRSLRELRERVAGVYGGMGQVLSDAGSLGDRIRRITILLGELRKILEG
jgi:hypothetical protein